MRADAVWADPVLVVPVLIGLAGMGAFAADLGSPAFQVIACSVVFAVVQTFFLYQAHRVVIVPGLGASARRVWRGLEITLLFTQAVAMAQVVIAIAHPTPKAALLPPALSAINVVGLFVFLGAMLLYPTARSTRAARIRLWLDAGTVMTAATVIVGYFSVGPLLRTKSTLAVLAGSLAQQVVVLVVIFAIVKLALSESTPFTRPVVLIGAGAGMLSGLAEGAAPQAVGTSLQHWVYALRIASVLACLAGAAVQERQVRRNPDILSIRGRQFSVLPYLALLIIYGLLCGIIWHRGVGLRAMGVVFGAVLVTGIVIARQVYSFVETSALLTERDSLAEELRRQAFHDHLTGLPNRAMLVDELERALAVARASGPAVALALIDLDDFKVINDRLGHGAGDDVLRQIAERLPACLDESDTCGRLGGDEFAVVYVLPPGRDVQSCAELLVAALREPLNLADELVYPNASIGIAVTHDGASSTGELLRQADVAMYAAKANGKGSYQVFEPYMLDALQYRHDVLARLDAALGRGDLSPHFQPIVDLRDQRILGVEALVRWHGPDGSVVPPAAFIGLAEETGRISEVDRLVFARTCRQVRRWTDVGLIDLSGNDGFRVHVNVSATYLQDPAMVEQVRSALEETGLPARVFTLELTETALLRNGDAALERLHELKALGLRVAIDDFGTGYSSLARLRDMPIDTVKIDKSFIDNVTSDELQCRLVHAIVELADIFRLETVVEGVETPEQAACLTGLGCARAQGYLFAPALPAEAITELLAGNVVGPVLSGPMLYRRPA